MKSSFIKRLKHPVLIITQMPLRIMRLGLHFFPFVKNDRKLASYSFIDWILDLPFYVIDIIGVPEIIETVLFITNPSIDDLSDNQYKISATYFKNCCDLSKVKLKSNSRLFTKKYAIAYVTFNVINFLDDIEPQILNHELTHICQYQKFGSVYIYRALKAQASNSGYDYGGYYGLSQKIAAGKRFEDLNFEQQAQFIEDYTVLRSEDKTTNLAPYDYYYKQFQNRFSKNNLSKY